MKEEKVMEIIILPIVTILMCVVSMYLFVRDTIVHKTEYRKPVNKKSLIVYSIIMILVTVTISIVFCTIYKENSIFESIKCMSLLCLLWPIAYIDLKSYRIPNTYIITGVIYRVTLFAFELFMNDYVWMTLLAEMIAAAALFLAAILCSIVMKNSIGFGDIKLFIVMGLLLGLDGIWGAIFVSLIVSFFISAHLLITKKKSYKDAIPFGPAIVIGTYLSVCLSGM